MTSETTISNKYRIVRKLGSAGKRKFSTVFLIEDRVSQVLFILKTADSELGISRLRQEALYSFQYAGLPHVITFSEEENQAFLILEYRTGLTWNDYLKTVPKKSQFETILHLLKLLEPILAELKRKNIAHLDIKPTNMLYCKDSNQVSLIDFGLSRAFNDDSKRKTLFPLGYAAPELLLNRLHLVDHRTDYFALAISIYHILEGKIPLLNPNPSITTNLQLTHPLTDAARLDKAANSALQKLASKYAFKTAPNRMQASDIDKALVKAMNARYENLSLFIEDFSKGKLKRFWFL
jgi:serine/threonine protein kinase